MIIQRYEKIAQSMREKGIVLGLGSIGSGKRMGFPVIDFFQFRLENSPEFKIGGKTYGPINQYREFPVGRLVYDSENKSVGLMTPEEARIRLEVKGFANEILRPIGRAFVEKKGHFSRRDKDLDLLFETDNQIREEYRQKNLEKSLRERSSAVAFSTNDKITLIPGEKVEGGSQ